MQLSIQSGNLFVAGLNHTGKISSRGYIKILILICLLLLSIVSLSAQGDGGFMPPKTLKVPIVKIPANMAQEYSPAEVLVLINILPDSSAILVRILDTKPELMDYVSMALQNAKFQPAKLDNEITESTLTLKLPIVRDPSLNEMQASSAADSLNQVDKPYLDSWIMKHRIESDQQLMFSSVADTTGNTHPQINDSFYRINHFLMGLNSHPYLVLNDGFIEPEPVYYRAMQYQLLANFRALSSEGNILSFANPRYTEPVLCTELQAALGDYEFNYARGVFNKNHLFGLQDLYTEFGFLVQNGYWQQTISDQTSTRMFLSYPFWNTRLNFNQETYSQDFPSTQLLPAWQNYTLFVLGQKWSEFYLDWQTPYVNVGYRSRKESIASRSVISKTYFKSQALKINRSFVFDYAKLDFTYQYDTSKNDIKTPALNSLNRQGKHNLLATVSDTISSIRYQTQMFLTDKGNSYEQGSMDCNFGKLWAGVEAQFCKTDPDTVSVVSWYLSEASRTPDKTGIRKTLALRLINEDTHAQLNYNLKFGTKEYLDSARWKTGKYIAFGEGYLDYHKALYGIQGNLQQTITCNTADKSMLELPMIQYNTKLKLIKELPYHNALSAGLNLTGHSKYHLSSAPYQDIYANVIADAWIGIKITDLFEFRAVMNNLADNTLYGVYPAPRTLMATIQWFYLN